MSKTMISLSIEADVMEKAREKIQRGDLSSLVENFLKSYLEIDQSDSIPEDMIEIIKEEERLIAQQTIIKEKLDKIASIRKKEGGVRLDFST